MPLRLGEKRNTRICILMTKWVETKFWWNFWGWPPFNSRWRHKQHDHICLLWVGSTIYYYALLLDISPNLSFEEILEKLDKRFQSSTSDITHQLKFQTVNQSNGESLKTLAKRIPTSASRTFLTLPDVHCQAVIRLWYGTGDRDPGLLLWTRT